MSTAVVSVCPAVNENLSTVVKRFYVLMAVVINMDHLYNLLLRKLQETYGTVWFSCFCTCGGLEVCLDMSHRLASGVSNPLEICFVLLLLLLIRNEFILHEFLPIKFELMDGF